MMNIRKIAYLLPVFLMMAALLADPSVGKSAAGSGLLLCGHVIIPSLFPFTVCVLLAVKCGISQLFYPLRAFSRKIFHLSGEQFALLLLSMIGGYPIGARLLNELVRQERISEKKASLLLCASVNAGPAFILLTVGNGLFHSDAVGRILLAAHLIPSFFLAAVSGRFSKKETEPPVSCSAVSFPDSFVAAVTEAANAVFNICAYVVFFSVFTAFWDLRFQSVPFLRNLSAFFEITCGLAETRNIYFVSFLLGFAGISVWCQVFSLAQEIPVRFGVFAAARILHGALSAGITFCLIRLFPVPLAASASPEITYAVDSLTLSFSMLTMAITFLLSLFQNTPVRRESP